MDQRDQQNAVTGEAASIGIENEQRRKALIRLGKTAAYAAPATLIALTMQAHATSGVG